MLEFILELLFEIILEGSIILGSEKKVPMPLRILASIVLLTVSFGMGGMFIYMGYEAYIANNFAAILLFLVGLFLICGGIYVIHKMFKKKKSKEDDIWNS